MCVRVKFAKLSKYMMCKFVCKCVCMCVRVCACACVNFENSGLRGGNFAPCNGDVCNGNVCNGVVCNSRQPFNPGMHACPERKIHIYLPGEGAVG